MKNDNPKLYLMIGIPIAAIAVFAMIIMSQSTALGNEAQITAVEPVVLVSEPEQYLEHGGRAVIILNSNDRVETIRGNQASVEVSLTYLAGANPYDVLTLVPKGTGHTIIPASIAKTQTVEERVNAVREGGSIPGGIPVDSFLVFSKDPITLKPGDTKTLTITVIIPQIIHNDLINDVIQLPMRFDVLEETGNTVMIFPSTVPSVRVLQ